MLKLKLKIPPALTGIIFALLMWLVSRVCPGIQAPSLFRFAAAAVCGGIGLFFLVSGLISFRQAGTTINPMTPHAASSLVTTGIYERTRNPMYTGLLFILAGWGLFLSNLCCLALLPGFVLYMNRFQIRPEEESLETLFGDEFLAYKKRVRRWL